MKTIAKTLLLGPTVLGAFLGLLATAEAANGRSMENDEKVSTAVRHAVYVMKDSQTLNVNIDKPANNSLRIALFDEHGNVLACRQLTKQDVGVFKLKFNVAHLEDGDYDVRILGKGVAANYIITLKTAKASAPVRLLTLN